MGLVVLAVLGQGALAVPAASAEPAGSEVAAGATATVTIGGIVRVGETVTAVEGDWSPGTPTFAYEWRSDGVPVPGAVSRDLVVTADLEDTALSVVVTGTDGDGAASSVESAASVVMPGELGTAVPEIHGTARVGAPLTLSTASWTPATATLTYQWRRAGLPITGQDGPSYTPVAADLGATLSVAVSGAADGYRSAQVTSADTLPVALGRFSSAPAPTLSGGVRVGSAVTVVVSAWSPAATFSYQWRRDGVAIAGATGPAYRPVASDRGHRLSIRVTGQRPGHTAVSRTSTGAVVGAGVFAAAPVPTVAGAARVGAALTARPGTWSPAGTLTYQWLRNGVAIPGATGARYRPTSADHTKHLRVEVTATRAGYARTSRTSAATPPVVKPFATAVRPQISGTARVGATLTARVGAWSPAATFSWQWRRNGVAIPGATRASYRVTAADHQRMLTVTVTGRRPFIVTASRTSPATARVAAPPPALTRDGSFRVGTEIAAGTFVSRPSESCYWERRRYAGDDFDGILANDFGSGQRMVTILTTDRYFSTDGCGTWTRLVPLAAPRTSVGDGVFAVGEHLRPGLYKTAGGGSCYWARLSGFSAELEHIIENDFGSGQRYVRLNPSDAGFESSGCGTWSRIAD